MFQDSINTYLLAQLNATSQGLTFKGGYIFDVDRDGNFTIKSQVNYRIEETDYTPVQIAEWQPNVQPYKRIDKQSSVFPLSLAFRLKDLNKGLLALDEFRSNLNGAGVTVEDWGVAFKVDQPTVPSSPLKHAGQTWIYIDIMISLDASKNLLYGNAIEFKIAKDGEALVEVITSKIDIGTVADTNTSTDDYIVNIKNGKQTQTITADIFYEDNVAIMNTLLDWLWQTELNQKFSISLKYTDTITKTGKYRITTINQHIEAGTAIGFSVVFHKSSLT